MKVVIINDGWTKKKTPVMMVDRLKRKLLRPVIVDELKKNSSIDGGQTKKKTCD